MSDPLNFFVMLNEGLRRNPPQGADLAMLGLLESLEVGPNKTFDPDAVDRATAAGLRRAVEIGPEILAADFKSRLGQSIDGWHVTTDLGSWKTPDTGQLDFLLRSSIAKEAQPGQSAGEAIYPIAFTTSDGEPLTGKHRYEVRFAAGQLPPVERSGRSRSMTANGFAIDNSMGRTQIGTYDDLHPRRRRHGGDSDSTRQTRQDSERNWLPAPDGAFDLAMRLYNPRPGRGDPRLGPTWDRVRQVIHP